MGKLEKGIRSVDFLILNETPCWEDIKEEITVDCRLIDAEDSVTKSLDQVAQMVKQMQPSPQGSGKKRDKRNSAARNDADIVWKTLPKVSYISILTKGN